jgi:hypothetical protein
MADITRDDVRQAVRDELANVLNDIHYIREAAARIDQRTSDLDETQNQVHVLSQQLQNILPQIQSIVQNSQVSSAVNPHDVQDTKLRVQNIEKGIAQIVQFLRAQSVASGKDDSYRGV